MRHASLRILTCTLAAASIGCASSRGSRNEVLVLGMLHSGHLTSEDYGLETLEQIIRNFDPDVVLTEIPPLRYDTAAREFAATGEIEESRVRRFPEYTEVLFPLQAELGFEIVPCAAWTEPMARERSARMAELRKERPEEAAMVEAGFAWIDDMLAFEGLEGPVGIHTDRYDEIVETGMLPYDIYWNEELGLGGWTNINAAHYAYVAETLDARSGQRLRVLITFGAWHKTWFRDALRSRRDIVELEITPYLPQG